MQVALLQETMLHTSSSSRKAQIVVSVLISFGVGMLLMSQFERLFAVQEPVTDMAGITTKAHPGGMRALPRNAPTGLRDFVNLPRAPRVGMFSPHRKVYSRPVAVLASQNTDLLNRLDSAIKIAEECVGECSVEWDNVEELSAAVSDSEPKAATKVDVKLSVEDLKVFEATMKKLKAAREQVPEETTEVKEWKEANEKAMKEIISASTEMKAVVRKASSERMATLDVALQAAVENAQACINNPGDDCAVEWDTVEELSAAKSRMKNE